MVIISSKKDKVLEVFPLWERQRINGRLEPLRSYEYFRIFLEMPKPRRLVDLREQLKELEVNKTNKVINKYSSEWDWFRRASAYDSFIDEKRTEAKIESNKKLIEFGNKWRIREVNDLMNRQKICKVNIAFLTKKMKDLEETENVEFSVIENINKLIKENNNTYCEISDQILKILDGNESSNDVVVNNVINNEVNPLFDLNKMLEKWDNEE